MSNALKRWNCSDDDQLPDVNAIKSIHVYDFDNTLFNSPLPNPQIWQGPSIGLLQNEKVFKGGGWWHDPAVLSSTGQGIEKEEERGWAGWWNETIVELVQGSVAQTGAMTVLLTGRSQNNFSQLIQRIVKSRALKFDMIVLKPEVGPAQERFTSTMNFKQAFLTALIQTYSKTADFKIYEDRPKHVKEFESFLGNLKLQLKQTEHLSRPLFDFEVVPVVPGSTSLDPLAETIQVHKMVNAHNSATQNDDRAKMWSIKRHVLFTGYLLDPSQAPKVIECAELDEFIREQNLFTLTNAVVIAPRPSNAPLLEKTGPLGTKIRWKMVGLGTYDNKVWAARVQPVPLSTPFYVDSNVPHVVLARRPEGRPMDSNRIQQWSPIPAEKQVEFGTVVGEKVLLRLNEERRPRKQPRPRDQGTKRPLQKDDFPPLGPHKSRQSDGNRVPPAGPRAQMVPRPSAPAVQGGRGPPMRSGRTQPRVHSGGHGMRGGRKGAAPVYRSLDDQTNRRPGGMDGTEDGDLIY